jgi:hypothetical protein
MASVSQWRQKLTTYQISQLWKPNWNGRSIMSDDRGPHFVDAVNTGERDMPEVRAADELTMLTAMLDWYRDGVRLKVADLTHEQANRVMVHSGTTISGLVKHLALDEDAWFTYRFADGGSPPPWDTAPLDVDDDWDFHSAKDDTVDEVLALYAAACDRSRAVTAAVTGDLDTPAAVEWADFTLRWVLVHMLEETARHMGHIDILRELIDGRTGE